MIMRALPVLMTMALCQAAIAQNADLQFELCVKQFDEFRDRFNGKHNAPPDPTGTAVPPDHEALLRSLLAAELDVTLGRAFIADVLAARPAYELKLDGEPWFAEVRCIARNGDRDQDVLFWLVREHIGEAHKWSILSTDLRQKNGDASAFIDSRNHECGFTDLLQADLLAQRGLAPYIGPPGVAGLFAVQEALVGSQWRITNVRQVRMHLLQVPGWFAEVEYRPPPIDAGWTTSGWNIIRLEPMSDLQKSHYIWNHVLGL